MTDKRERGLLELYADDPERADALVFGRRSGPDRRGFLKGAGLATMGAAVGAPIVFASNMPTGLIPAALAQSELKDMMIDGKDGLVVLADRPLNAESTIAQLDADVTPTEHHFIRNNGAPPDSVDPKSWKIVVEGEVNKALELTLDDLKSRFETVTYKLQIECAGNGRAGFNPPAKGNQWTYGAVGNSEWTGVRLADVLKAAGLKSSAVYTGHYGADAHLSGDPSKQPLSRGVPIEKAMNPYTIIAFAQNGKALHPMNGAPVRLVAPGWAGSCSQKWLTRVWVRDQIHDGAKMEGDSYRVPAYPVAPGASVPKEDFVIVGSQPVKSVITAPSSGTELGAGSKSVSIRGHAWAGDRKVTKVEVSPDFGVTWMEAKLEEPPNPYSWQRFSADVPLPGRGYYEIWARATDASGAAQPFTPPWNPKGYHNNAYHRIAVTVAA